MAAFGDLVVRLGLDKTGFSNGISSARSTLTSLKSVALPAAAAVAAVGGAFAAAAIAIKDFVAPSFEALDSLGDLSSRLGVATDKLAALQYAAGLAGIEQGSLTTATGKYLDTLSNAVNGVKSAQQAFDALGLSTRELRSMELDAQFALIADRIRGIQDPADRMRIAMDLFGKSGGQMLQLLNDGGQQLIATLNEAQRLGIAPKPEDVAKIQAANDAIDKMNAAWRGVANTLAIELAPDVETFASIVESRIPAAISLIQQLFEGVDRQIAANIAAAMTLRDLLSGDVVSWTDPNPEQAIQQRFENIYSKIMKAKAADRVKQPAEIAPDAPLIEAVKQSPAAAVGAKSILEVAKGSATESSGSKNFSDKQQQAPPFQGSGSSGSSTFGGALAGSREALDRILQAGRSARDEATAKQIELLQAIKKAGEETAAKMAAGQLIGLGVR